MKPNVPLPFIHFLQTPAFSRTPWWRTDERLEMSACETVLTDCCCCSMPAGETDSQFVSYFDYPHGGLGGEFVWGWDWEDQDSPTGAWYGGDWKIRCAEGFGCFANPRRKFGMHLREMMRWGP